MIARAQASAHATTGRVGVVGFSLGGAAALTYATRLPEQVATVVAMYPLTSFIQAPADFVGKIKVPVLMLAGTADTYKSCCTIEMARALADAARKNADVAPLFVPHEYDGAEHGFDMNTSHQRALVSDSRSCASASSSAERPYFRCNRSRTCAAVSTGNRMPRSSITERNF